MSLLTILHYPDPRLRTKAKPVTQFGARVAKLANNMLETMYDAPGVGLAATQIDVHERIIVVDVSPDHDQPHILVNPQLTLHGELEEHEEGCLSVPDIYETVKRVEKIHVSAVDPHGKPIEFDAEGMLAVCIQHECDHLDGKLFVDYLSSLKRTRIRKKLEKQQRQRA